MQLYTMVPIDSGIQYVADLSDTIPVILVMEEFAHAGLNGKLANDMLAADTSDEDDESGGIPAGDKNGKKRRGTNETNTCEPDKKTVSKLTQNGQKNEMEKI